MNAVYVLGIVLWLAIAVTIIWVNSLSNAIGKIASVVESIMNSQSRPVIIVLRESELTGEKLREKIRASVRSNSNLQLEKSDYVA